MQLVQEGHWEWIQALEGRRWFLNTINNKYGILQIKWWAERHYWFGRVVGLGGVWEVLWLVVDIFSTIGWSGLKDKSWHWAVEKEIRRRIKNEGKGGKERYVRIRN